MRIYTIGFTKKSARQFFELLRQSGAKSVVDVRLNNVSQLAGFAKKEYLAYFLETICGMGYQHLPLLAPTQQILDAYKKGSMDWESYERSFWALFKERAVERAVPRELLEDCCLLCSKDSPARCHRRLVAEYFKDLWGDVEIIHLR